MKKIVILVFVGVLVGCAQKKNNEEQSNEGNEGKVSMAVSACCAETEGAVIPDTHSANVSLDYMGEYKGVVSFKGCESANVEVTLGDGGAFNQKVTCLKTGEEMNFSGAFVWNGEGNQITLNGVTGAPNQFFVGENRLFLLDEEGKRKEDMTLVKQ